MAEFNLGNVVGLLRSFIAPIKKYLIWAKNIDNLDLDKVVLMYYDKIFNEWLHFNPGKTFYLPPVIQVGLNVPPVASIGDAYIIGSAPSGAWIGKENYHATWMGNVWEFITPRVGTQAYVIGSDNVRYNGLIWETSSYLKKYSSNYIVVESTGLDSLANGLLLKTAWDSAQSFTPNGIPLSANNRATVFVTPGNYNLAALYLTVSQFVDLVGIGSSENVVITSTDSVGTLQITDTNNYKLQNFSIDNTGGGKSLKHNASQVDNGIWLDLNLNAPNTEGTTFAGSYRGINGYVDYVLCGNITGVVEDSTFYNYSCGYQDTGILTVSGTIKNCTGGTNCFGRSTNFSVIMSGIIENCRALNSSFGISSFSSATVSGLIKNCHMTAQSGFGYASTSVIISGQIIDCSASFAAFGYCPAGPVTISGTIRNCVSTFNSFGYSTSSSVTISGTILNCVGTSTSFGYSQNSTVTINPTSIIKNCIGTTGCFGRSQTSTVLIQGLIEECVAQNNSFGSSNNSTVTISGMIKDCIGLESCFGFSNFSSVVISGTIDNCKSSSRSYGSGGNSMTISGYILNCLMDGGGNSFGYSDNSTVTISGRIINCVANTIFGDNFGRSNLGIVTISGLISNCKDNGYRSFGHSFGNTVTVSGIIENCSGTNDCFGAGFTNSINITGSIKLCRATNNSFGYKSSTGTLTISGIISDCIGTSNCFGSAPSGTVTITSTAIISNCIGTSNCFGMGNTVNNGGVIKDCIATINSFGTTSSTGKLIGCTRIGAYGIHSGTIENCNFSDNSASPALTLSANSKVKYSTIYQSGAGQCFDSIGGPINASVYLCSANKAVEAGGNITNLIITPYNVIDTNINI